MGWIELGRIGAPWGVKGWMHIETYTDPPAGLLEYRQWVLRLGTGERITRRVADGHPHSDRLVARLEGIEDRDKAAALTGAVIEVDRAELPPTGDREYYRADLVGFKVRNLEDVELGTVGYFVDTPTGPMMVVQGAREHWVLAIPKHLRKVDLAAGLVLVDWPAEP
ncbi:MAG: rRNA processing protein RimM [Gammaproteobacteria bacterium]|jgi:16S rRNA processing protein RimM|nr:rRNA processing protein RimM [Gammaproteobacteria bacterium]